MTPIAIAGAVAAFGLLVILAAAHKLVVDELVGAVPALAAKLVRRAARRFRPEDRDRYTEEWLAELWAYRERRLSGLAYAVRLWVHARALKTEVERLTTRQPGVDITEQAGALFAHLALLSSMGFVPSVRIISLVFIGAVLAFEAVLASRGLDTWAVADRARNRIAWLVAAVAGLAISVAAPKLPPAFSMRNPGVATSLGMTWCVCLSLVFFAILTEYYQGYVRAMVVVRSHPSAGTIRSCLRRSMRLGLRLRVVGAWAFVLGVLAGEAGIVTAITWEPGKLVCAVVAVIVAVGLIGRRLPRLAAIHVALNPPALIGDTVLFTSRESGGALPTSPMVVCNMSIYGAGCRPASGDPRRDLRATTPSVAVSLNALRRARVISELPAPTALSTGS